MAIPAARDPGPLVILLRLRVSPKVRSMIIWSLRGRGAVDLGVCVVDGVFDAAAPAVSAVVSTVRSLPNCNGRFGWPGTVHGCGVGRGRGRAGGAAAGSRQRVRGCGGWRVQDVGVGSHRWRVVGRVSAR